MMVFSNFFYFSAIFLKFSIPGRVKTQRNDFFFLSFAAFPILFWLEKKLWWFFLISWIFLQFFGIFYSGSGWNLSDQLFLFSLFLGLSYPILAWKEAMMVFYNFLNFSAIFLKFSIPSRVENHRNDFFFLSFSAVPIFFWLEKKLWWFFLIF